MSRSNKSDSAMKTCPTVDSSAENNSKKSEAETYSDRKTSTGSEVSEFAIHILLLETRARDLDREVYQDPDSDRYLFSNK